MFDFSSMIYTVPALLIAITIHEYAHALTADAMGDPTPRYLGRLTFNPLAHLDILGAIMLALFHFGWAKPVPVNPRNYNNFKKGEIVVSLAGVTMNLILAVVGAMILYTMLAVNGYKMMTNSVLSTIAIILYYFVGLNCGLIVFNLIPIPPLDGSRIVGLLIPNKIYYQIMKYERYIIIVVFVLLALGWLSTPLSWLTNKVLYGISWLVSKPFGEYGDMFMQIVLSAM